MQPILQVKNKGRQADLGGEDKSLHLVTLHLKSLTWPLEGPWASWKHGCMALEGCLGASTHTCLGSTEAMTVGYITQREAIGGATGQKSISKNIPEERQRPGGWMPQRTPGR